jgi:hypothetical protein
MSTATPLNPSRSPVAAPKMGGSGSARESGQHNAPQPPDPQLVAEMKQEIRILVQEIAELAATEIGPEEFYAGFLARVVSAMAAVGGAVWIKGDSGKLKLAHSVNLSQTGVERSPQERTRHGLLIKNVMSGTQAILVPPGSAGGSDSEAGNPTDLLLVLSPLIVEKEAEAVVEIFQRGGGGPSTQRGYLRFLVQMCDAACDYLKNRKLRELQGSQSLWRELEQLVQALHRSLDLQETAYAVVNEGRRMIGCDRVSLALAYGSKCRVEAVSGLDSIDRRATEVQRLAKLATAVLRTREPLWSEAGETDLPTQIEQPLQAYIDQSHARLVAVLPLVRPGENESPVPIGALIIEQLRDARAGESLRTRSELVAQHSAAALTNAIEHSSVLLLPLWKMLGKATWLFRGRTLPKTLLVLAILIGGITALAVIQTDFEVAARGKLQPAQRSEVFAPLDGIVASVPVRHGQVVEPGTVLAELTSTDMELQLASLIGRQTTNQERLAALQRALLDTRSGAGRLTPAEENRLAGEVLELRQEAENIERELALVRQKQQQLTIVARERGQVVTWKVEDLLLHRPVQRGQGLLTLADPKGPWELELYLPERRLTHVLGSHHAEREDYQGEDQDVTFTLASHPGQTFHGRVVEIEQAAEVRGEEGNTVLVRVAVDRSELPPLHDQTTVTAKLHCGRTSLGYAWFCDLIETVQSKVLFWLPS